MCDEIYIFDESLLRVDTSLPPSLFVYFPLILLSLCRFKNLYHILSSPLLFSSFFPHDKDILFKDVLFIFWQEMGQAHPLFVVLFSRPLFRCRFCIYFARFWLFILFSFPSCKPTTSLPLYIFTPLYPALPCLLWPSKQTLTLLWKLKENF